jgi:hypothetical protein
MVYRPYRQLGRIGLAACVVSLGAASLSAQSAPSTTAPVGPNPSRVDIFLGYSYFGAHGQVKPANIPYSSITRGGSYRPIPASLTRLLRIPIMATTMVFTRSAAV